MAYSKKTKKEAKKEANDQACIEMWRSRIKKYEDKASDFIKNGADAWAEFLASSPEEYSEDVKFGDRAYAHVSRFVQSSYFSRIPKVIGSGDFDKGDPDGLLASFLAERLAKRFVQSKWFPESIEGARDDYVHTARGVTRVYVDVKTVTVPVRKDVQQIKLPPDPNIPPEIDQQTGQPIMPEPQFGFFLGEQQIDPAIVKQDEAGFYIEEETTEIESACPYLGHVSFKDYFHTPNARNKGMVTWEAYRLQMDKQTVKERWPDKYDEVTESKAEAKSDEKNAKDYFEIFECWCKAKKEVLYLFLEGSGVVLERLEEDPFGLEDFFPSVGPLVSNKLTDKLWGVCDYTNYIDKLKYLKAIDRRRRYLSTLLRRNGIGDGKHREALQVMNENQREGDIVFVDGYKDLVNDSNEAGSLIKFFPVEQYISAFKESNEAYLETRQEYYEYFGLEKLLTAQKSGESVVDEASMVGSLGLLYVARHRKFQEFIQENVRTLVDLAIQILPEKVFKQLVGYDYLSEERKFRFPKAYAILQNDFNRAVRVDIDLDSTIATSQAEEAQANMQLFQTVTQSLGPLTDVAQTKPEFVGPLAGIVMAAVQKMKGGNSSSDELGQAFKLLQDKANQPPPEPTGPTPEEQKLEIQRVLAEHKIQQETREQDYKEYINTREQEFTEYKQSSELQLEQLTARVNSQEKLMEEQRLAQKHELDMQPKFLEIEKKNMDLQMQQREMQIKLIELAATRQAEQTAQAQAPQSSTPDVATLMTAMGAMMASMPQPVVNVAAPTPTKRVGTATKLPNGQMRVEVEEVEEEED